MRNAIVMMGAMAALWAAGAAQGQTAAEGVAGGATLPLANAERFVCGDGRLVALDLDEPAGVVRLLRNGEVELFMAEVGASPPRYVGSSGSLVRDGDILRLRQGTRRSGRTQACQRLPETPRPGVLWGTVTKRDRLALPEGTRIRVLLADAERSDAPATEVASTMIVTRGNQMPLHFRLAYPPARVEPAARRWRLDAIAELPGRRGGSAPAYAADGARFVLEAGPNEPEVELVLVRVGGEAP